MPDQLSNSQMSEDDLLAIIESEESQGLGSNSSGDQLNAERARALDLYNGRLLGNEMPGRSSVVTRETLDTIEWIVPQLFRVFASGDEVVKFDPVGPEDVAAAEQETQVVNWVVTQQNNWPTVFYTWAKDALLSKTAYIWAQWDTTEEVEEERYQGLSDDQIALIAQDDSLQIVQHQQYPDEAAAQAMQQQYQMAAQQAMQQGMQPPPPPQPPMLHDVVIRLVKPRNKVRYEVLPAEQTIVSNNAREVSLENADFFEFWDDVPISKLRAMGYEVDDELSDNETASTNYVQLARDRYNESSWLATERSDASMKRVRCRWVWVRADWDGDGIAELVHVVVVGRQVLAEPEKVTRIPVAAACPVWMPHRHVGMSAADLVADLQILKTTIMRQLLDNLYISNNSRTIVSDQVNLDDMMSTRPGGIVRLRGGAIPGQGHVMPLVQPVLGQPAYQMLEYVEQMRETRTGTSRLNQGLQPDALTKTASGTVALLNAGQQKIELMARLIAEGVSELFRITHELLQRHSQKALTLQVHGQWVTVDPREWRKRQNCTISVGLGTGDKGAMMQSLITILQAQKEAVQIGVATPKNIYNALVELTKAAGFRSADKFWTDPEQHPQQPQPNPEMVKVQQEAQAKQAELQLKQQELQMKAQAEAEKLRLETEKAAAELQLEREKAQAAVQIDREKAAMSAEADMRKHEMTTSATVATKSAETQASHAKEADSTAQLTALIQQQGQMLQAAIQALGQRGATRVVRDGSGRIAGAEPV
jgi:hypothetical protein